MKLDPDRKAQILFAAVLAAGLLAGLGWYVASAAGYTTYQISTKDPVSGLIVDAPIEFHGVEVGKVKRIELVDARTIRVLLSVRDGTPVSSATVATITSRGLATRGFTGYVYVSLEDVGEDRRAPAVASGSPYPVIPTAPSRILSLDVEIDEVNRTVGRLSHLLEGQVLPQMMKTLKHVDDLSVSMDAFAERLNRDPGILIRGAFHKPKPEDDAKKK
jgi:phospholipid/cholesterol/gamma-HCH transport system substrate-binding protein